MKYEAVAIFTKHNTFTITGAAFIRRFLPAYSGQNAFLMPAIPSILPGIRYLQVRFEAKALGESYVSQFFDQISTFESLRQLHFSITIVTPMVPEAGLVVFVTSLGHITKFAEKVEEIFKTDLEEGEVPLGFEYLKSVKIEVVVVDLKGVVVKKVDVEKWKETLLGMKMMCCKEGFVLGFED